MEIRVEQAVRPPFHGGHPLREPGQGVLGNAQSREQAAESMPIGPSDLLVRLVRESVQEALAVLVLGPGHRQRRQRLPAHLGHLREKTGQCLDQESVHRLVVPADTGERHALDVAVDRKVLPLDQALRDMGEDPLDRLENLRLVVPGPDDHRQGVLAPDPHRHGRTHLTPQEARHRFGERQHVVLVVVPAGRLPQRRSVTHERLIGVIECGAFPAKGAGKRRCAHWPLRVRNG